MSSPLHRRGRGRIVGSEPQDTFEALLSTMQIKHAYAEIVSKKFDIRFPEIWQKYLQDEVDSALKSIPSQRTLLETLGVITPGGLESICITFVGGPTIVDLSGRGLLRFYSNEKDRRRVKAPISAGFNKTTLAEIVFCSLADDLNTSFASDHARGRTLYDTKDYVEHLLRCRLQQRLASSEKLPYGILSKETEEKMLELCVAKKNSQSLVDQLSEQQWFEIIDTAQSYTSQGYVRAQQFTADKLIRELHRSFER